MNLPERDMNLLAEGLRSGGTVIIVRAEAQYADRAKDIIERHHAKQVDARTVAQELASPPMQAQPQPAATTGAGEIVIPVVREDLAVGKRCVERGGVRVFSHLVETPVEEQVRLREEHANTTHQPVNRPISEADLDGLQDQTIEVRETAEEPVVAKTARVVEELRIDKEATERTEQIRDTLRRTEVDVEQVPSDLSKAKTSGTN